VPPLNPRFNAASMCNLPINDPMDFLMKRQYDVKYKRSYEWAAEIGKLSPTKPSNYLPTFEIINANMSGCSAYEHDGKYDNDRQTSD
jgi:hypothetical protein